MIFSVAVPATERLDRFLADQLGMSRTQSARLVAEGCVAVAGKAARASRTMVYQEVVDITEPDRPPPRQFMPRELDLSVVYEDEHLAVIDKPAGLVVHPAPGHWDDTLVNALVARGTTLAGGAEGRPGIVHRLDRDTSGLILVAKSEVAHRKLSAMIAARRVTRVYAALIWGHLDASPLVIDAPIARDLRDRKRMAILADGRRSRTDAFVAARLGSMDLVRLELHSGRTHQIRVHLESVGHPIVGDPVYAGGGSRRISGPERLEARRLEALAPRQALHAALLAFRHPITAEPLRVTAPWPADLWPLLEATVGAGVVAGREVALQALGFFPDDG
ncbi:MAG TPA: RluA family pseudouridine synthase [Gemmatimonadales bacterium]|jgi:23S rRNA pseudouridine1911/1915/1917 synthase